MGRNNSVVFRVLVLVCVFLLFGVSIITQGAIPPTQSVSFAMSKGEATRHKGLVLNYVSKRRVPNGPDPIHNRYANTCIFIFIFIVFYVIVNIWM
ncbi:hypothetical protein HanXRQr2_Chr09g0402181 [Helianthus annuus]|uniref:CLAVATA3/ESR (CLE)-related protein 25 n=1 Tax=Helianthus annuus TaxID=4232 RepID=A0A9K3N9N0_HELAN|nr:hypothetical protein HanXRQr2_Chr09g0402181 [Helianthus annuus]KAJ0894331.1 hypothetical protein HanPSC8_Chr09g0387891 [Helianthus annuus]